MEELTQYLGPADFIVKSFIYTSKTWSKSALTTERDQFNIENL